MSPRGTGPLAEGIARARNVDINEGCGAYHGAHCRTLVVYMASERGSEDPLKLIETSGKISSFLPADRQDHALMIFAQSPVPRSNSFARRFQDVVDGKSCPFMRVVLYSTQASNSLIRAAYGPAITSVKSVWGKGLPLNESVVKAWIINAWTEEIVVAAGEKNTPARLWFRLNFATHGWDSGAPLELCQCEWTGGLRREPKAWRIVQVNNPAAATAVRLQCSWCNLERRLFKPATMPSPFYRFGAWYCELTAVPVAVDLMLNEGSAE
ncbi:hypothetical protein FRC09_007169 [Ceratobasidium sp. 395]|nr:hypothetical protein FRC09_007169 [Ceratobasidium sp. 395]